MPEQREKEEVGAFDAKTRLAELLRNVEAGAAYVITRRGKPVAHLIPPETGENTDFSTHINQMKQRRNRLPDLTESDRERFISKRQQ